jgi:hypothetical protein
MRSYISFTKLSFLLLGSIVFLSSCSSWHYHQPRVRVDLDQANELTQAPAAIQTPLTSEAPATVQQEPVLPSNSDVASIETQTQANAIPATKAHKVPAKTKKEKKDPFSFIQKLKDDHQLFQVQDVEKTAMANWVRIMIILFVVGFVFLIVGIILTVTIFGGLWWIFYVLGSICILAACIILILGLVGVMV